MRPERHGPFATRLARIVRGLTIVLKKAAAPSVGLTSEDRTQR